MPFTKADLIERSGLPDRTIRNYIKRGLIPPPVGYGPAAVYDEEVMTRAVAIGRMRAGGMNIDEITVHVEGWTAAKWRRYVRDTEPQQPPPPAPEPVPGPAGVLEGEPVLPGAAPRARLGEGVAGHDPLEVDDGAALPEAPAWRIYSLITGLGLMVDADAPPVVHRIAAEILARYGRARR